jgi:hypothetical protein
MPTTNDDDVAVMPQQTVEPEDPSNLPLHSLPYPWFLPQAGSPETVQKIFDRVQSGQPVARSIYEEALPNVSTAFPFRHVPVEERGKQLGALNNLILSGASLAIPGPKGAGKEVAGAVEAAAESGALRSLIARGGRNYPELRLNTAVSRSDYQNILADKTYRKTLADTVRPLLPKEIRTQDPVEQLKNATKFFEENKIIHHQMASEYPWYQPATKQYEGYNIRLHELEKEFGHPVQHIAVGESGLSPQTPPDQSFSMIERLMRVMRDGGDMRWDARFDKAVKAKQIPIEPWFYDELRGKTYNELNDLEGFTSNEKSRLKAMWARTYDQAFHKPEFRVVTPSGELGEIAMAKDGKTPIDIAWKGFGQIAKGIRGLEGEAPESLLTRAKISNYYNSKIAPNYLFRDWVPDTHDSGSSFLSPVTSNTREVETSFGGPENKALGHHGLSALHIEAGNRAAAKLGMVPSDLQAGIWSHQQGFMSADALPKKTIADIRKVWKDAGDGKYTVKEARAEAIRIAKEAIGKARDPTWARKHAGRHGAVDASQGNPANSGELYSSGGIVRATGSRVGSGTSGGVPGYQQGGEVTDQGPAEGDLVIPPDQPEGPGPDDEVIPPDQPNHVPMQHSFTGGSGRNVNLALQGYTAAGASPVAAAALLGDSDQESGFKPDLSGDNQTSWGLHQVGSTMYRQFLTAQKTFGVDSSSPEYIRNQASFIANRFRHMYPKRWAAMNQAPDAATALRIFRSTPGWNYGRAGGRYQYAQSYQKLMSFVPGEGPPDQSVDQNIFPAPGDEIILPDKDEHAGAQASKDIREAHDKGDLTPNKARKLLRQVGDPTPDHLAPPKDLNIEAQNAQRKKQGLPPLEELKQAPPPAFHGSENHNDYVKKMDDWRDWIESQFGPSSTTLPIEAETGGKTPPGLLGSPETPFPIDPKSGNVINTLKLAGDVTNSLMQGATTPDAIMSLGLFSLPYVPEAYLLDVAAHVPDQYIEMRDRLKKQGMTWENASRIAQTAVNDVLALLPFAARKYLKSKGELKGGDIYAKKPDQTPSQVSAEQRVPAEPEAKEQVQTGDPRDETPLKTQGTFAPPFVDPETGFVHYRAGEFRSGVESITQRFPGAAEKPPETAKPVAPPAIAYDKEGRLTQEDGKVVEVAPSVKESTSPGGIANRYLQEAIDRGELPESIMVKRGGQTREAAMLEGRDWINKGGDPRLVAARIARGGAASRPELNGIHAEYDRLRQLVRQLDDDAQSRPADAALRERLRIARGARDDFLRNILPISKAFASDALKTLQGVHPVDAETFSGLEELFKEHNGVTEINDTTRKALRARSNGAKKLADKENGARKALDAAVDREFPDVHTPSPDQMREIVNKMAEDLTPCK